MMDWIILPSILVGLMLIISIILIVIEKLMGGDKEKVIHINDDTTIPVRGDDTLLNALANEKIFVPSACGGKATCGFCKVRLLDDDSALKPTEEAFVTPEEAAEGVHLSCQIKTYDQMKIVLPKGLLTAKEYHTKVTHVEDLTYDIKLVRFHLIDPETIYFKPGQYVQNQSAWD